MRRRTFRSQASKPIDKEKIYLKGAQDYQIDVNDIEVILQKLLPHADKSLKEAPEGELEEITNTVNVLCNTEYYPALQEVILKYFSCKEVPNPGTLRAYMVGCTMKTDPCSSVCAGSAPADSNFSVCPDKVIIALPEKEGHSFTCLNESNSTRAILYLPITSGERFSGLTSQDKIELEKMGIKEAKIMRSKEDTLIYDYTDIEKLLYQEKVNSSPLPSSSLPSPNSPPLISTGETKDYTTWIVIAIAVVIILLLLLWWNRGA